MTSTNLDPRSLSTAVDTPAETTSSTTGAAQSRLAALIYLLTDIPVPDAERGAEAALQNRSLNLEVEPAHQGSGDSADMECVEQQLQDLVELFADAVCGGYLNRQKRS